MTVPVAAPDYNWTGTETARLASPLVPPSPRQPPTSATGERVSLPRRPLPAYRYNRLHPTSFSPTSSRLVCGLGMTRV